MDTRNRDNARIYEKQKALLTKKGDLNSVSLCLCGKRIIGPGTQRHRIKIEAQVLET